MVKYEVKIAGVKYPFTFLRYIRSYEIEAQRINVTIPVLENVVVTDMLEILRDGETAIKGRITDIQKKISPRTGTEYLLIAYDLKRKLQFLPSLGSELADGSWGYPVGTELTQHLRDNLANTELTEGTFNDTGKTYSMVYGSIDAKFDRRRLIQELCFVTGWEFYADPNGVCDFKQQCGSDLSSTIIFKRKETLAEWLEPFRTRGGHKVKRIVVEGKNIGDLLVYGIAQTTDYTTGDEEKWINHKTIVDTNAATDAANALLADFQNTVSHGKIKVIDVESGVAYDVFDTIKIVDDEMGVDGTYRITEIDKSFDVEKGEETIIEFTDLTKINVNAPYILKTGEQYLYDTLMGVDNYGKLVHASDTRTLLKILLESQIFFDPFYDIDTSIWEISTRGASSSVTATIDDGLAVARLHAEGTDVSFPDASLKTTITPVSDIEWILSVRAKVPYTTYFQCHLRGNNSVTGENVGFFMSESAGGSPTLQAVCTSTSGSTSIIISGIDITQYHNYKIYRKSSTEVRFYIDDILKTTVTTNIPTSNMNYLFYIKSLDNTAGVYKELYLRTVNAQGRY